MRPLQLQTITVGSYCGLSHIQSTIDRMASQTVLNGQFVKKSKDVVTCVRCSKDYKYHHSTSSLSYHLRVAHGIESSRSGVTSRQRVSAEQRQTQRGQSERGDHTTHHHTSHHSATREDNCTVCQEYHQVRRHSIS